MVNICPVFLLICVVASELADIGESAYCAIYLPTLLGRRAHRPPLRQAFS